MLAVWLTGGIAAALFVGLAWYLAPLKPGVLALQFAFTPQAFTRIVGAWPAEHLARYRHHLPVDGLLLVAYGLFGPLLATRTGLFAALGSSWQAVATWALPLAAACDALEDVLHWKLTAAPRPGSALVHAVSATASAAKWALLLGFGLLVAGALLTRAQG